MKKTENEQDAKPKEIKKKIAKGGAAAGIGISLLLASLFQSPEELTQKNMETINRQQNTPVVMMMDMDVDEPETEENTEETEKKKKGGVFSRIKNRILQVPAAVRAVVGVPLWAVGWVIIHVLSIAWSAVLSPVLAFLLKWVLGGLALLGVFALAMKCAFPDLPLKKILRPKNILFILLGTVILGVIDWFLPMVWKGYGGVRFWILLAGGFLVLLAVGIPFLIRHGRKSRKEDSGYYLVNEKQ